MLERRVRTSSSVSPGICLWLLWLGRAKTYMTAGDDTAALAAALGVVLPPSAVFAGPRLKRGAIVIENGKVLSVGIEDSPANGKLHTLSLCSNPRTLADFSHRLARRRAHQDFVSVRERGSNCKESRCPKLDMHPYVMLSRWIMKLTNCPDSLIVGYHEAKSRFS
jgi:hypothetical protein